MDRKVRDRIRDEIKKKGKIDKEYVVQLIKMYDEVPDVSKLIEQNYKAKADRLIAGFKDENRIRDCFAIKNNKNKTKYVDISKPTSLTKSEIEIVKNKHMKLKKNKEEVILKASLASQVLEGQIALGEFERTLKQKISEI